MDKDVDLESDLTKQEGQAETQSSVNRRDDSGEELSPSRGRNVSSSGRLTSFLRSSLRFSLQNRKTPRASPLFAVAGTPASSQRSSHVVVGIQRVGSVASTSSYCFDFCRICHETDRSTSETELEPCGKLIAPCLCDGSLKYVHEKCIQRWIEVSRSRRCELCHFDYEMRSYTKPMKEWRCCLLDWRELRNLFCFVSIYLLVQACVVWALYALISNLIAAGSPTSERNWQFWLKVLVVIVGVSSVGVFAYIQVRYCCGLCQRWRRSNRVCVVQEPSEERISKLRLEQRSPNNEIPIVHEVNTFTAMP